MKGLIFLIAIALMFFSCKKNLQNPPHPKGSFTYSSIKLNNISNPNFIYYGTNVSPVIALTFTKPLDTASVKNSVIFSNSNGVSLPIEISFANQDSTLYVKPNTLSFLTVYTLKISPALNDKTGDSLQNIITVKLFTGIDSTDKFQRISDSALLTLVQQQTFKYFWDFGHPISGMARERNSSGDVCTTGGTGFSIMSMLVAVNRGFISRTDALNRIQKIVSFYKNKCTAYHGAYAHWINGATGVTIPFSTQDDGADLVETSYLMQGLLCARQYFNQNNATEDTLRNNVNALWNAVDWNWFRQGNQNVLYWHWSPDYGWAINQQISGWNEAMIVYALAASSNTNPIPKIVYDNGWAQNGEEKNNNVYYDIKLPLGPAFGGPLFFAHYSFLGINPQNLSDAYANYWTQDTAHTMINYNYCINNPNHYFGYSNLCWGLTASDEQNGYSAHSPQMITALLHQLQLFHHCHIHQPKV